MQTVTMTRLNNATAAVLDAVERGEVFQIVRRGKPIGYLTPKLTPPTTTGTGAAPDWDAHFAWLRRQPTLRPDAGDRTGPEGEVR